MLRIEWEYLPAPDRLAEFIAIYSDTGAWVRLFRRADGYVSTQLLAMQRKPGWYRTIDRWQSAAAYQAFLRAFAAEYQALDAACAALTLEEIPRGSLSWEFCQP